jgi:hypothetical protein
MGSNLIKQMVIAFDNQSQPYADTGFKIWCEQNPEGFYLNAKTAKKFTLHMSGCHHAGVLEDGGSPTSYPKFCSHDLGELIKWALEQGAEVVDCGTCL